MLGIWGSFFCSFLVLIGAFPVFGRVILLSSNVTLSFEDTEANFAPQVKGSGKRGMLYVAEPLDACWPLVNKIILKSNESISPFVLIIRGGCSFEDKVREAQAAGFGAAIIFDYEDGDLVAMAGHSSGIKIHAIFVSKESGETLRKYSDTADMDLWIVPNFINSAWSIMGISSISLLAMCSVVVSCFFVRRHRIRRRERPLIPRTREFQGMSRRMVKAMPSLIFAAAVDDNCTSRACAVCLEDYIVGEKLRILPCSHKFHAICVDTWLTSWRTFCPVCKRDARTSSGDPPPSESTPLLLNPITSASSMPSLTSSASSPSISPSASVCYPTLSPPNNQHPLQSQSPNHSTSQTSASSREISSHRPHNNHLVSHLPPFSSFSSRFTSPYYPTS